MHGGSLTCVKQLNRLSQRRQTLDAPMESERERHATRPSEAMLFVSTVNRAGQAGRLRRVNYNQTASPTNWHNSIRAGVGPRLGSSGTVYSIGTSSCKLSSKSFLVSINLREMQRVEEMAGGTVH